MTTTLLSILAGLVLVDIVVRVLPRGRRAELPHIPQQGTTQPPDLVLLARPLLNTLGLDAAQLSRLVSNPEYGRRFYDYALDHQEADGDVLEVLAQSAPTTHLGKVLAHPRATQKAKETAQARLREEAERAAAADAESSSDDGYECEVGGPSCCGRGQGPYYH